MDGANEARSQATRGGADLPAGVGDDKHERLLQLTLEAIRHLGASASMDEMADFAGVSKPTLYRVFGSKEGLYRAATSLYVQKVFDGVVERLSVETSLRDFIELVVDDVLALVESDAEVYNFLMRRARMELVSRQPETDFVRELSSVITMLMTAHLESLEMDVSPVPIWSAAVVGMLATVADWWVESADRPRSEVTATVTDLLWRGFSPYSRES